MQIWSESMSINRYQGKIVMYKDQEGRYDMAKPLEVAFIGGAYDSAVGRTHRIAAELDHRFKVVAGCFSRNLKRNERTGIEYGIDTKRVYANVADLLDNEADKIDAIVILTPQNQHIEHLSMCLKNDIPIICEKALVSSVDDAVKIKHLVDEGGKFLAVTYNYTGYPMVRELKAIIDHGDIGQVQQIHIEMPQDGFTRLMPDGNPLMPQQWRLNDNEIPTISLDLGIHIHMLIKFLIGQIPESLVAVTSSRGNFRNIVDNVLCIAKYSNEIDCNIWYSKAALGYRNGLKIRIFGSDGSLEWIQEHPEFILYTTKKGTKHIIDRASEGIRVAHAPRYQRFKVGHPAGFIEAFANYYYDIADALTYFLKERKIQFGTYVFGIDESIEGLAMLEAISRSSRGKKWERVDVGL